MKNKFKIVLISIFFALSLSNANAGLLDFAENHPILSSLSVAGGVLYEQTTMHKARELSYHLSDVDSYFQQNPNDFNPIANYVLNALAHPANENDYVRYKKLAEVMELENIPPYSPPEVNHSNVLVNPQQDQNPNDNNLVNPIQENPSSNIIYTPQGEPIDTSIEFPHEEIHSWKDYLYAESQSKILADHMKQARMGERPHGYAAHHIVAWNDNRYPVCQDLRNLLKNNNIDLNDAENGVYLPTRKATQNPNEAYHPEIHTEKYYEAVFQRLVPYRNNPQGMKNALKNIGQRLKNNQFTY